MTLDDIINNYKSVHWLQDNCKLIHYFGLGFIQLKLSPEYRLHFYTSKLAPIVPDEDIHDHRYPFNSYILKGTLTQAIYEMIDGNKYVLEYESCQEGQPSELIRECDFKLLTLSVYSKDSTYFITDTTFHQVYSDHAITLISRPEGYWKSRARVAHIKDAPKVCPFSKKVPEKELWDIVKEMLC